jgi:hypothetical protein
MTTRGEIFVINLKVICSVLVIKFHFYSEVVPSFV